MQSTKAPDNLNPTALSEESVEQFYAYGFAQYNSGNWDEAAKLFQVLCSKRPLEARFWFALGATLQEAGSYLEALHSWAMAALLKKEDPYPHFHAAECYFSLKNTKEALQALKEAEIKITKEHPLEEKIMVLKQQWTI